MFVRARSPVTPDLDDDAAAQWIDGDRVRPISGQKRRKNVAGGMKKKTTRVIPTRPAGFAKP